MMWRDGGARGHRPPGFRRRWFAASVLLLVAAGALAGRGAEAPGHEPTEYEVKAAFLYHFAQLVDWPQAAPGDKPFVMALVGEDVFGRLLEDAIGAEKAHNRSIRVVRARSVDTLEQQPDILFLGARNRREVQHALALLANSPVLTVGEIEGFADAGGMIGFRLTPDGRIGFDINLRAADQAGLRLSSQLLKIARIVGPRP
jgi:YfiR/HmsC-like